MPITSSAKKALRSSKRKRVFNLRRKNEMQGVIKEYKKLVSAKKTEEELRVFELLITVSGVGPKSGLAILSVAGVKSIEEAVAVGDTSSLTKISGIGRKTAEKIVLELNGKLVTRRYGESRTSEDVDVFEALKSLGYRERDIQETIKKLPKDLAGTNEKIKYILKNLGK